MSTQSTLSSSSSLVWSDIDESHEKGGKYSIAEHHVATNSYAALDLECNIQSEHLTKLLNDTIYKIKLAICLPELLQEQNTLEGILSTYHMNAIFNIFNRVINTPSSDIFCLFLVQIMTKELNKPEIRTLCSILISYPDLKPIIDQKICNLRKGFGKQTPSLMSSSNMRQMNDVMGFLYSIERFQELMIKQMTTTAAKDFSNKLLKSRLEIVVAKYVAKINDYMEITRIEREQFEARMKLKKEQIARFKQKLSLQCADSTAKLKKKILQSDHKMVLSSRTQLFRQEIMKEEDEESKQNYHKLLSSNQDLEKQERHKRMKADAQVASWVQKYDTEIAYKQECLESYIKGFQEEKIRCEKLKMKLEKQDLEYMSLMSARDEEYHQEMTEKMNTYMQDHAVAVIQTAWEQILANRIEKKKLLKALKKIQKQKMKQES